MAIVTSNYAAKELLEPLGISMKGLKRCHIFFEPDDLVLVKVEYALHEPSKEAKAKWKRYALTELKATPKEEFDDIIEILGEDETNTD